jgi:hypothetical protein
MRFCNRKYTSFLTQSLASGSLRRMMKGRKDHETRFQKFLEDGTQFLSKEKLFKTRT